MRTPRNQTPEIIQELQPNNKVIPSRKTCKCDACEQLAKVSRREKPKLPKGMRRLKVYYKAGSTETIPVILLQGEWIRKLGFDIQKHVLISEKPGQLIINLETE